MELVSLNSPRGEASIGLSVLSREAGARHCYVFRIGGADLDDLHTWIHRHQAKVYDQAVSDDMWQAVASEEDRVAAEKQSWMAGLSNLQTVSLRE